MQAPIRLAVIAAAALLPALTGIGIVHAEPDEPPIGCSIPADMTGKSMVMYGTTPAMPTTPLGNSMTMVRFESADHLQYRVGGGQWQDTSYTASNPEPGVVIIEGVQLAEPGPVNYSVTLRCHTNDSGDYTFSAPGAPVPHPDSMAFWRFTNRPS
ncbi:hypothetical protein [Nocardia sp. NPDC051832]|uniref:hypothetical protein n=1 Tax=Nocardia sp. NPDC051832 TaxID=3155673 RepID=UPI00341D5179